MILVSCTEKVETDPNTLNTLKLKSATGSTIPILTTTAITAISANGATSGGNITDSGGGYVIAKGVCWSTTSNPTIANSKTNEGQGSLTYTSYMTSLTPSTTYYFRAYATNTIGNTGYGNEISFTTTSAFPTLTTTNASFIYATYVTSGGNITYGGEGYIIAKGVCWSTTSNPTIENSKTYNGQGAISFVSNVTELSQLTTYYARAYATTTTGKTGYGNEINFTTPAITLPIVNTNSVSLITSSSAFCGGYVNSDGGSPVTARGVCWSTSNNPTIANSKTTDGIGSGSFTSSITGLTMGTTYYAKSYATNVLGTAYGNEMKFRAIVIGNSWYGGVVAYVYQPGDAGYDSGYVNGHGLIAAPNDQSTSIRWYNGSDIKTNATATALGAGVNNTNTIVSIQGTGSYAAKLCYDLVLGGQNDWYLPSKDELLKLWLNKATIGGFANEYYWSSSEIPVSFSYAYRVSLYNGLVESTTKNQTYHIRAVRYF